MHYLQKYKGKSTRHTCPACETNHSFTLYLNGDTHEPIHRTVGICNRESKCGYHYTPKQYFIDNPSLSYSSLSGRSGGVCLISKTPLSSRRGVGGEVPFSYVQNSASYKSNFIRFLCEFLTVKQMKQAGENYALGATKSKEVIFWQIDIIGKVRTGKIMQYNPTTGKRIKHQSGAIDWVHNKLKKTGALPEDFNLQQCFFGEHLLKIYPEKSVAIVESEKSAIIASSLFPDLIWLAAGNLNGLSIEKCQVLMGRDVTLYPDLGAYEKWSLKATEIQKKYNCNIILSNLLEVEATDIDREKGLDIADYIIAELILLSKTTNTISPFIQENVSEGRVRSRGVEDEVIPEILKSFKPNL
ncbi:MAG: DUF6371 domain-containing protein [Paludibacter sp.]